MGGFSTGNLQHNYNALTHGIDNWIYAVNGGNDGKPYWWGDPTKAMDLRGQDFRFNLETKQLERLGESSGGFGLGMDEYGRFFETHNLTHVSHLVFPDRYRANKSLLSDNTLENISDHEENGLSRVFPLGEQEERVNHPEQSGYFSGACGISYYGGGALGDAYKNTVWVADVVLNLIHVDKIEAKGASFVASRKTEKREFLASTDRSFRPVSMSVGPDGAMYVLDMHRKVIEHPEWIPDEIEKTLDMKAGTDQGRIYRISLSKSKKRFDFKTQKGLVAAIQDDNQWVRNTAQRLLLENNIEANTQVELRKLLQSDNELARLHALWILANKNLANKEEVTLALKDLLPAIRENALKISERFLPNQDLVFAEVLNLLKDPNARVRMQAALSLSTVNEMLPIYLKNKTVIMNALAESAQLQNDDWNIAALTLAAQNQTAELFSTLISQKNTNQNLLASLALNANNNEQVEIILKSIAVSQLSDKSKQLIVHQLLKNTENINAKKIEPFIKNLEPKAKLGLLYELAALRNQIKLPTSPEFLNYSRKASKSVLDATLTDSLRIQYLAILDFLPYQQKSNILFECLKNKQPLKLQEGALRQLSNYKNPEIGKKVVSIWSDLSPQTRNLASDLLLYVEANHDALLTGLENGSINIGEMNFDLERRRTLLWWTKNENTKQRAKKLFSDSGVSNRKDAVAKMQDALTLKGSMNNGRTIFTNTCATCHKYGSIGNDVGPVLTEINRKSKATLLHEILDPNAATDPKYINHKIETKSGAMHFGIIANENDKSITIKKMGGEKVILNKSEIKSFRSLGTSLMMEGFENALSQQDMADLLEFLQKGND
jgi:putative membrane-bound dehydrogenase-like protein